MIPSELYPLLEPLERFEAIRRRVARLGGRLADLSYANPYEGPYSSVRETLRLTLAEERGLDLQYAPFGGQTLARRAAADALGRTHGLPFTFRDIVLTPGAMSALHLAFRATGEPDGEIVIPVPCWLDYPLYASMLGLRVVTVPLAEEDFDLDIDAIRGALTPRTCALLLCNPANPTGRSYKVDVVAALAQMLRGAERELRRPITIIADETHRDFAPALASAAAFYDRTIIVYSFGKYHFMQGQRLGYAGVSPRHPERLELGEELVRWTRITGIATPTALMQRALPRLLELEHDLDWVEQSRARLLEELKRNGYDVVVPDATFFVYVRTPTGYEDDFAFIEEIASQGLLALPAQVFHHQGWFRLSMTGSHQMLDKALAVLGQLVPR